jgi:hypothetical protein
VNDPDDQVAGPDEIAFDDPAYDGLRAELAAARVTSPIPADVAARLDATLASLRAEHAAPANVVPLRRRLAPVLVAAAAAVVVVAGGVGIAQISGDGSSRTMSADSGANNDAASPAAPPSGAGQSEGSAAKADSPAALASVPALTTARFAEQVARIDLARLDTRDTTATAGDSASRSPAPTAGSGTPEAVVPQPATACPGPALPHTESVPILLDGHTAVLVLHAVTDGKQVVDAWSCDGTERLATAAVTR